MVLTQTPEEGLKVSNAPSDGKFLQYKDSTDKLTWTSVGGTESIQFNDDVNVEFGTNNDGHIRYYNSGLNSWTGGQAGAQFVFATLSAGTDATPIRFYTKSVVGGSAVYSQYAVMSPTNKDVALFYNGNQKFITTNTGIGVTGEVSSVGATDLTLNTNAGSNSGSIVRTDAANGDITITPNGTGDVVIDGLKYPQADGSAGQFLKTDGSGQLSWGAAGSTVGGATGVDFNDTVKARWGTGNDLEIHHSSNGSYIKDTSANGLRINSANFGVNNAANDEQQLHCVEDGAVTLFHNGTEQCSTSANGLAFPSGKGIDFSATANGSGVSSESELFSDYEHGKFTPTLFFGSTEASYDAANTEGYYVKMGKLVWINAIVTVTSQNSGTGGLNLRGFPFDQETSDKPRGGGYICQWYGQPSGWTNQPIMLSMDTNNKCYFRFYNGSYMGDLNGNHLDDSYWFQYVITYFAT